MADFAIRARRDGDLQAVADLLLASHHSDGYPVVPPADLVSWGAATDVIGGWVAVGPSPETVVGHAVLTEVGGGTATDQWVAATGRTAVELAAVRRLVVGHRVHRTGIGRTLLAAAVDAAHALGRRPVLDMSDGLSAARTLYERAGFETIGAYDLDISGHRLNVLTWIGPEPVRD